MADRTCTYRYCRSYRWRYTATAEYWCHGCFLIFSLPDMSFGTVQGQQQHNNYNLSHTSTSTSVANLQYHNHLTSQQRRQCPQHRNRYIETFITLRLTSTKQHKRLADLPTIVLELSLPSALLRTGVYK